MKAQKNIVSLPNTRLNDLTIKFNLETDAGKKKMVFNILTNIKVNEIMPVLNNWIVRTNDYTEKSFVAYINSKSHYGFKAKQK